MGLHTGWAGRWVPQMRSLLPLGIVVAGMGLTTPALAVTFDQQDVDNSEFILVASPVGDRFHQLLILRQLSDDRPCWADNNGVVDLLLLSFDFTNICGRSTDSNGYSVRMGNQDLGIDYRLQLLPSGDSLILTAVHTRDTSAPSIAIGQTDGINSGFARIDLYPGWYISQRAYEGQALGHFYLTNADDPRTFVATATPPNGGFNLPSSVYGTESLEVALPVDGSVVANPAPPLPTAIAPTPIPRNAATAVELTDDWIEFSSQPAPQPAPPSSTAPYTPPAPPVATAVSLPPPTPLPAVTTLVPVPSSVQPPVGNTAALPEVTLPAAGSMAGSSQAAALGFNYRVIVNTTSPQQEAQVRSLVPDAFRTRLNGQTVMQAGLFTDQATAEQLRQSLVNMGLAASVLPVN